MPDLLPSADVQQFDGEEGHDRPPDCDHRNETGALQNSSHQEVYVLRRRPSMIERNEEAKERRGNGETPGDGRRAKEIEKCDALSFIRHSISHSGNVLEQHHVVYEEQIFRAEQWLVFCTARPLSAFFKLQVNSSVHTPSNSLSSLFLAHLRIFT